MNRFNGTLTTCARSPAAPRRPWRHFRLVGSQPTARTTSANPPAGVSQVEIRVGDYLIGTASITSGHGTVHYTFNVATENRVIDTKGLAASGDVLALGNGIIDSIAATCVFVRQTGSHEYEIGLERAPASWATVEVQADGTTLTDLDSGAQRSPRRAVRFGFSSLGTRALTIIARDASGTVVDTRTRSSPFGSWFHVPSGRAFGAGLAPAPPPKRSSLGSRLASTERSRHDLGCRRTRHCLSQVPTPQPPVSESGLRSWAWATRFDNHWLFVCGWSTS